MNALKNFFINEGIENAFNLELKSFLNEINEEQIPSNFTTFYNKYKNEDFIVLKNIKINNKILHQSKLLNYFEGNLSIKSISKDLNDL